jgi:hypothetical protein
VRAVEISLGQTNSLHGLFVLAHVQALRAVVLKVGWGKKRRGKMSEDLQNKHQQGNRNGELTSMILNFLPRPAMPLAPRLCSSVFSFLTMKATPAGISSS